MRFMLLLLADEGASEGTLEELERSLAADGSTDRASGSNSLGLPLLEPMVRALHRAPHRLEEIDQLLRDIKAVDPDGSLLPPELEELWRTVASVRDET